MEIIARRGNLMGDKNGIFQRPDYLVCTCMEVMYSQIVAAVHEGAQAFESLSERLGVGTGCSSCVEEVYEILKEVLADPKK